MKTAWIYMASGFGSRFGENKLMAQLEGKPLYRHGLDCLLRAKRSLEEEDGWQVCLIVVSQYREILETAAALGVQAVYNGAACEGIAASLRLGTGAAPGDTDFFVYCVADQPGLGADSLTGFLRGYVRCGKAMGCVSSGGRRGNPAAFGSRYRQELTALTGDRGGSRLMKRYPEDVWQYEVEERELRDVDLPEDLRVWRITGEGRENARRENEK